MAVGLSRSYLLCITIVSAATIAYEILLLRLFSIIQWHHFAFMIISLALLGYGVSGVFLALSRKFLSRHFPIVIIMNMLLLALAMPVCFLLAQALPFNPAELLWDPRQLLYWLAVYLILAIPFFFAANIIGLSFYQFREAIARLYAVDLFGAALGSLGIITLLSGWFVEQILLMLPVITLIAALLAVSLALNHSLKGKIFWQSATACMAALILWQLPPAMQLNISAYKGQSQFLHVPQTKVIKKDSSPLAALTVVESKSVPLRYAPGLSITSQAKLPEQLAVFNDADAMMAITRFNTDITSLSYLSQTTSALPFQLRKLDEVLILGAGTGSDVLQALYFDVSNIHAVEQNPQIIRLLTEDYAAFSGDLYRQPRVAIYQSDAREFVTAKDKQYDLVSLSLMDSAGSTSGGLHSMSENYLYTVEAIQQYLQHLKPNGYLSLTQWIKLPPRDMPKLLATVVAAMKQLSSPLPSQSLILIRNWQTATILVKNGTILLTEIDRLKQFCQHNHFDLVYYPGINVDEINRFHRLKQPYFYLAASALLSGHGAAFIDNYKFNIKPATDDQPYFSQFFKWKTLPEILSLLDKGGVFLLENGYLLLIAASLQSLLACLLFLLLPLWLWQRRQYQQTDKTLRRKTLIYFFSLGLAFLFVEIAFIQKFILILHHPVYAVSTVLAGFLLAGGLGSYMSEKLIRVKPHAHIIAVVIAIVLLSLFYLLLFESISAFLLQQQDWLRYLLAIIFIFPLGLCMGMPFPTALRQTTRVQIPWAWGINGFASVISPIVATLIAMQFGFRTLISLAVVLYLIVAFTFPTLDSSNSVANDSN